VPQLKKQMKNVMPFVAMLREEVARVGVQALELSVPFDELAVMKEQALAFSNALGLQVVVVDVDVSFCLALTNTHKHAHVRALSTTHSHTHAHTHTHLFCFSFPDCEGI
jgi:hypothetical protein